MTSITASDRLDGKVALVTGASRRIGRATALGLARKGARLVVNARSAKQEIDETVKLIQSEGGKAIAVLGDVTSEEAAANIVAAAGDEFGRLDVLVNNAAVRKQSPFLDLTLDEWRDINSIILDGAFLMSRAAIPLMLEGDGGTIVNIGGVSGHMGATSRAHVVTAKAGLVGLTKAIATEFAARGITANCVVPGKIGGSRSATSGAAPKMETKIPLGRMGEIDEAASVIVSVSLPYSRFMTGQTVHVSGGLYMP